MRVDVPPPARYHRTDLDTQLSKIKDLCRPSPVPSDTVSSEQVTHMGIHLTELRTPLAEMGNPK